MVNPVGAFDAPTLKVISGARFAPLVPDVPYAPAALAAPPAPAPLPAESPRGGGSDGRGLDARTAASITYLRANQDGADLRDAGDSLPGADRSRRAPADSVDTGASEARIREEALAKLASYQAERARRYPASSVDGDYRKALQALRDDVLFFGSLSPLERALPEVARALQSSEVLLPLRELSLTPAEDPDPRAPFVRLAGRFAEVLGDEQPASVAEAVAVREAVAEEIWRVLGIARREPAFAGTFSPESESLIDQKLREAEAAREARRSAADGERRVSVLA